MKRSQSSTWTPPVTAHPGQPLATPGNTAVAGPASTALALQSRLSAAQSQAPNLQVQTTPQERCITTALAQALSLADLIPRHQRRQDKMDKCAQPDSGVTSADVGSDSDSDADLNAPAQAAAARAALDSALPGIPRLHGMATNDTAAHHCQAYCLATMQAHTCHTAGHHLPETCGALHSPNSQNIQLARLEVLSLLSLTAQPDPQLLKLLTRLLQMASDIPMTLAATALLPGSLGKHMALALQAAYLQGSDLPLPAFGLQGTLPPYIKTAYLPPLQPGAIASQDMFRLSIRGSGVWEAAVEKAHDLSEKLYQCLELRRTQRTNPTRQLRQKVQQQQIAQHRQTAHKALQQLDQLDQWQTPIGAPIASTPATDPRLAQINAVLLVDQHQQSLTQPEAVFKALAQHPPQTEALQSARESVLLDCLRQDNPPAHLALLDCLLRINTDSWFSVKQTSITQALAIPEQDIQGQSNALKKAIDTLVRATKHNPSPIAPIALCCPERISRSLADHAPNLGLLFSHPGIRGLRLDGVLLNPTPLVQTPADSLVPMARSASALERLELANLAPESYTCEAVVNLIKELPGLRELALGAEDLQGNSASQCLAFARAVLGKNLKRLEITGSTSDRPASWDLLRAFEWALNDPGSEPGAMQQPTLGTVATTVRITTTLHSNWLFGYLASLVRADCSALELNAAEEALVTFVSEGHPAVTDWLTAMEQRTRPLHLTLREGLPGTGSWLACLPSNRPTGEKYTLGCLEALSFEYTADDVGADLQDMCHSLGSLALVVERLHRLQTLEVVMNIGGHVTEPLHRCDPSNLAHELIQTGNKTHAVIPPNNAWSIQFKRSLEWARFGRGPLQTASWAALLKQASGRSWPTEIVQRILDALNKTGHAHPEAPALNRAQLLTSVEHYEAMQARQIAQSMPVPAWVARHPRHDLAEQVKQRRGIARGIPDLII